MSAKNKIKLNYKQLRLSDEYLYSSEEEQEKKKKKNKKNKKKNKIKKTINTDEYIEWMINKEDASVNDEVFQKYF